jgi:hypothetical protein
MVYAGDENPERHAAAALAGVRLAELGRLAATVAFNAQEPAGKGPEWLAQGLGRRW